MVTIKNDILKQTSSTMNKLSTYITEFAVFEHIWMEDRDINNSKESSDSLWIKDQVCFYPTPLDS